MPAQAYVQPVAGIAAGQIGPSAWNCRFYPCLFLSHFFHVYHVSILRGVIWYGTWLQGHSVTVAAAAAAVSAAVAAAAAVDSIGMDDTVVVLSVGGECCRCHPSSAARVAARVQEQRQALKVCC